MIRRSGVFCLAIVLAALSGSPAPASTRSDFNEDWPFRTDPDRRSVRWTKSVPAGTRSVRIPTHGTSESFTITREPRGIFAASKCRRLRQELMWSCTLARRFTRRASG